MVYSQFLAFQAPQLVEEGLKPLDQVTWKHTEQVVREEQDIHSYHLTSLKEDYTKGLVLFLDGDPLLFSNNATQMDLIPFPLEVREVLAGLFRKKDQLAREPKRHRLEGRRIVTLIT